MASQKSFHLKNLALIGVFAVVIALCAWISVPAAVPFTLQTFGICCTLGLLGGKRGTLAITIYILLGAVGVPVFAGFAGGPGVLLGTTGGYILGFIAMGLLYWGITALFGTRTAVMAAAMVVGLLACYAFGTLWYMIAYARQSGAIGLGVALSRCVVPFLLPDALKLALALLISKRVSRHIAL